MDGPVSPRGAVKQSVRGLRVVSVSVTWCMRHWGIFAVRGVPLGAVAQPNLT